MTTSQGWALLGLLGALASGLLVMTNLAFVSLRNEMRARFDGVGTQFESVSQRFDAVSQRFDGVSERFDGVSQRFDGVDRRLDALDRDVQTLAERVFRDRP